MRTTSQVPLHRKYIRKYYDLYVRQIYCNEWVCCMISTPGRTRCFIFSQMRDTFFFKKGQLAWVCRRLRWTYCSRLTCTAEIEKILEKTKRHLSVYYLQTNNLLLPLLAGEKNFFSVHGRAWINKYRRIFEVGLADVEEKQWEGVASSSCSQPQQCLGLGNCFILYPKTYLSI